MPDAIETLLNRIDASLRRSDKRIIAAEQSGRQSKICISESREAIGQSKRQLVRLRDRDFVGAG